MKSIIAVLMALFCLAGLGAATFDYGYHPPNVPPVVVPKYDTPSHTVVAGGTWLQDESFLAGSGMSYTLYDMTDDKTLVVVETTGLDQGVMESFAKEAISKTGASAVYFSDARTVVLSDGTVKTNVTLDLHNQPAIARALKTLF